MAERPVFQYESFHQEPYGDVYERQKRRVEDRILGLIPDTLLLGEHPHVITTGRGTDLVNILRPENIPVVEIERGGDVTYHGPGQLVGYPILQLRDDERDLHRYLRNLEEALIRTLHQFDISGVRKPGWTGVWVGERKIASIGVAVRKWVTYHGFALNVTTDLHYFSRINPCGLPSTVMTSLSEELARPIDMSEVIERFLPEFEAVIERQLVYSPVTRQN